MVDNLSSVTLETRTKWETEKEVTYYSNLTFIQQKKKNLKKNKGELLMLLTLDDGNQFHINGTVS